MSNSPEEFNIEGIFRNKYIIPLYQRNYAWEEAQVTQLIQDIWDYACLEVTTTNYYIGTLVVHKREINNIVNYETIDGQQRLTTINILLSVLKNEFSCDIKRGYELQLQFDSRPISSQTLKALCDKLNSVSHLDTKMQQAYLDLKKKLSELFNTKKITKEEFIKYLFNNVKILRVEVPFDTDLNHYFEIMNNRGEQLEKHEILKAELLSYIKNEVKESDAFSMIWDACSNMERYIQYGFKKEQREAIFNKKNWDEIPNDFESFVEALGEISTKTENKEKSSFLEVVASTNIAIGEENTIDDETDSQFNSIVSFPNFLLHVLRIYTKKNIPLDDKRLIDTFKKELEKMNNDLERKEFVKEFAFSLLKSKFLFDKYIIKREYKSTGEHWSLQSIKLGKNLKPYYSTTFDENKQLVMLLSMFHVSFPQMIYKHWLNGVLNFLFDVYDDGIFEEEYIEFLESMSNAFYYDRFGKIEIDYYDIIYKNNSNPVNNSIDEINLNQGTNVQNYIFNRLDYLIWKTITIDESKEFEIENISQFEFSFRSSVEHFYPQNPKQGAKLEDVKKELLDNFGNLCLISRSKNSELSNYSPIAKAEHYSKSSTIESLKQQIMLQKSSKWNNETIVIHQENMISILNDI